MKITDKNTTAFADSKQVATDNADKTEKSDGENAKTGANLAKTVKKSWLWGVLLFFILILVDQVTKLLADAYLSPSDCIPIVKNWLEIRIVYNRGISYGIGDNAPAWVKIAVIAATGVMMAALAIVYFKVHKSRKLIRIALVFIVAGGVGNLIDRVYFRVWDPNGAFGVRDMVDVSRFGFAVCNFADFFITAGAIMLVLSFLFFDKDAAFPVGKYKAMRLAEEKAEEEKKQKAQDQTSKQNKESNVSKNAMGQDGQGERKMERKPFENDGNHHG